MILFGVEPIKLVSCNNSESSSPKRSTPDSEQKRSKGCKKSRQDGLCSKCLTTKTPGIN